MWIRRSPEEIAGWHQRTRREARLHGLMIASVVWIALPVVGAGGWFVSLRGGFAAQTNPSSRFWVRLLAAVIVALPVGWWAYRRESRKELGRLLRQTICPKCEAMGEGNAGAPCQCGGVMAAMSEMKWVKEAV